MIFLYSFHAGLGDRMQHSPVLNTLQLAQFQVRKPPVGHFGKQMLDKKDHWSNSKRLLLNSYITGGYYSLQYVTVTFNQCPF